MPETVLFPLFLLTLAIAMLLWHLRARWQTQGQEHDAAERGYLARQFRRRMQASSLLALLAIAIFAGLLIPGRDHPWLFMLVWLAVLILVAWMVLLAMADLLDNRYRLARLRDEQRIVQAQLQAELARVRSRSAGQEPPERRNGQSSD